MTTTKETTAADIKDAVEAPAQEPATLVPNDLVDSISVTIVPMPPIGEVITGPAPYTKAKAENLDKRITATIGRIGTSLDTLEVLVKEAKDGQIHIALGFASWTAYFADRVSTPFAAIGDRQVAALMLHEEGASNRAIAATLGVSPATVVNDVKTAKGKQPAAVEPKAPVKTTGKDGKEYTRKPTKPKAEVAQPKPKTQIEQLVDLAVADVENVIEDLETLNGNLEKLYSRAAYKPGSDKEIRTLITKARKLIADLPKAPAKA